MAKRNQYSLGATSSVVDLIEIGKQGVTNHIPLFIYGANPSVGVTTVPIWPCGPVEQFPASAQTLNIVSTSTSDTLLGTGARSIRIAGLDDNYDPFFEDIDLDGTTPVTTSNRFFRVNNSFITAAGADNFNQGEITIDATTPAATIDCIPALIGISQTSTFTIPRAMDLLYITVVMSVGIKQSASVQLTHKEITEDGVGGRWTYLTSNSTGSSTAMAPTPLPDVSFEKTDLVQEVTSSMVNTDVLFYLSGILIDSEGRDLSSEVIMGF